MAVQDCHFVFTLRTVGNCKIDIQKLLVFLLILASLIPAASAGNLNRIKKALEKNDFEKAEKNILKSLQKDTLNPGARYFYSVLFIQEGFSRYNLDSSRVWINQALAEYPLASEGILKDLEKADLTHADFLSQKEKVTVLAFQRSINRMSQRGFEEFMEFFPEASRFDSARFFRDSLAYDSVRHVNTWQAFEGYFKAWPESPFSTEARANYQSLIFKDYTEDDQLESYVAFLEQHPETPFRERAEEIIFTRSTADHKWGSYTSFLSKYPETHLRKKAGDILYYKVKQEVSRTMEEVLNVHSDPDSLRRIHELEKRTLFPVMENGRFGFWSTDGEELIEPVYEEVSDEMLCGNITNEWLMVTKAGKGLAISRAGDSLLNTDQIFFIDESVLLAGSGYLYHKSGYRISDQMVEKANVLTNGWIAFQSDYKWGLMSPAGHWILRPEYNSIQKEGSFIILEKNEQFAVSVEKEILSSRDSPLNFIYDDYEVIGDTLFQGFMDEKECLLNENLSALIPLDKQNIYLTSPAWYVKKDSTFQIFDRNEQKLIDQKFVFFDANEGWLAFDSGDEWLLISKDTSHFFEPVNRLDSIKLISKHAAFAIRGDSLQLLFQNGERRPVGSDETIRLLGNDQKEFFLVSSNKHRVFDSEGKLLFEEEFDEVGHLADSLFRVEKGGKTGVITAGGRAVVPINFDLIDEKDGLFFLLKKGKIGCYDKSRNILIPPEYEARIVSIGPHYMVKKDGKLGLVNDENDLIIPADFHQFVYWNDTSVWTQNDTGWKLLSFRNEILMSELQSVNLWRETPAELLAILLTKNGYGLYSNERGEILPPQYNDIVNVGSESDPVFFAEQHLKTAAFFVVTYFNRSGQAIRSQAFRPQEYEMIYCDQ